MGYGDFFSDTWKAFTDHPIIPLKKYSNKKVFCTLCGLVCGSDVVSYSNLIVKLYLKVQNIIVAKVSVSHVHTTIQWPVLTLAVTYRLNNVNK